MARKLKDLNQYPPQFFRIIEDCALHNREPSVEVSGYKQYKAISGLWYQFIGNLKARRDTLFARRSGDLTTEEMEICNQAKLIARVVCIAEPSQLDPKRIVWRNRSEGPIEKAMAGLQVEGPAEPEENFDDLLRYQANHDAQKGIK